MYPRASRDKFMVSSMLSVQGGGSRMYQSPSRLFLKYHEEFSISASIQKPSPFKLQWMNGYNHKVGVINLNDKGSTTLFYSASNCGVLYNWTSHQMWLLQGHRHMITCIASDENGTWLVTADSGPENVLIVWDYKDLFPQKTLFSPHGHARIAKVALSADAKYMLTVAYPSEKMVLFWWIWSYGQDTPHATFETPDIPRDGVVEIGFNPSRTDQFLIMTRNNIYIGSSSNILLVERGVVRVTDRWQLNVNAQNKVQPEYGKLLCYTFVKSTSQIIVGTSRGAVLVYGYTIEYSVNTEPEDIDKLRYIKMLKLNKRMIHVIKNVDGVIVTGNSSGEIHFYDDQLKLLYWVHGFTVDRVKGLSFNVSPRSFMVLDPACNKPCPCWEKVELQKDPDTGETKQKLIKMRLPTDASVGCKQFLVRDFIVCTNNQGVGFVDFVTEKYHTILDNKRSCVLTFTVHPEKFLMCVGYKDGVVELFNFMGHKLIKRLDLRSHYTIVLPPDDESINCNYDITVPELSVTCLQYTPSGMHLACGLNTGQILFFDPTTIDIVSPTPHFDTKGAIKHINFSEDSKNMATADDNRTVCVYKYDCALLQWLFIGKHRSHYKEITAVVFLPARTFGGEFKLVSLGLDRCLVEYDIGASGEGFLEVTSLDRMDQSAVPLAAMVWPTPDYLDPAQYRTNLPTILIANDEYKYKILNYATNMTLATVLGPRYDHPVSKMQLITKKDDTETKQYLLFSCKEVVGLQKMPLDGNPWKHVGLLAHPIKVLQMCFREDLGILFTIGARDTILSQWSVEYKSVDRTAKRAGIDLDPYYCLVEDGRPGWLFQEIRDLFYYIQILCQGTFSPARRQVKDYIPIESLPDLMRALGFFPSEYEVDLTTAVPRLPRSPPSGPFPPSDTDLIPHLIFSGTYLCRRFNIREVENLLVEAKYKVYLRSPVTEIDFEEFVKLYLNHRPVFGESFKRLRSAFRTFANVAANQPDEYFMKREDFIDMLCSNGEFFSRELCWYLLTILTSHSFEDRALMNADDFSFLPEKINFSHFVTEIIGIQEIDNGSVPSGESMGSSLNMGSMDSDEKLY